MLHVIFYETDGEFAKAHARSLKAAGHRVKILQVDVWDGETVTGDVVTIRPDVQGWKAASVLSMHEGLCQNVERSKTELQLAAKHRGRGKFYVMRGDEIVSGPHTKDEAMRLCA